MVNTFIAELRSRVSQKPKDWRLGQAYFNYAYQMFPEEVDKLRGTDYDCFYSDSKIPIFLKELSELLSIAYDPTKN